MLVHQFISIAALLVVLGLCCSLIIYQWVTGVPPLSSSATERADIIALLKRAELTSQAVIYELGSGWGSLVIALARAFPEAQIRGIELSPFPYWVSRLRTRNIPNIHLQRDNFYNCDLSDAQAVTCYLMSKPMPKLAGFLDHSLAPGTPVVSLSFWFRERNVSAHVATGGALRASALYRWPARKSYEVRGL
ncbi:MAG: class I SAM-dependent methyltransferase [Alphaproteobacteria bacterium]|nr:class I SAM-dependent methyltransferase [Alphaproteobacteria bacterium]